jgi:EKC/KEOPS complex subunit PCC1/LAGE3
VTRTLEVPSHDERVLRVQYQATTNRMLRVAVNGFFESLGVVIHCMEELDVDVISNPLKEPLVAVQGLEESQSQN